MHGCVHRWWHIVVFINEHFGTKNPAVLSVIGGAFFFGIFGWFSLSGLCDDLDFLSAVWADEGGGCRYASVRYGVISC